MLYKLHTAAQFIHSIGESVHLNVYLHHNRQFLNRRNTCQEFKEDFIAKHYSFAYIHFSQLILYGYAKKKKVNPWFMTPSANSYGSYQHVRSRKIIDASNKIKCSVLIKHYEGQSF
jgi:hypothetical protein